MVSARSSATSHRLPKPIAIAPIAPKPVAIAPIAPNPIQDAPSALKRIDQFVFSHEKKRTSSLHSDHDREEASLNLLSLAKRRGI